MGKMSTKGHKSESDINGRTPPEPGSYHVIVSHVDASGDQFDGIAVTFQVLAGTVEGMEGRTLNQRFYYDKETGEYQDSHVRLALASGLIEPDSEADVDWDELVGRQLVIGIEKRSGKDKEGNEKMYTNIGNFGLAVWSVKNPAVEGVPKDKAAIKKGRELVASGAKGGGGKAVQNKDDWDV